MNNDQMRYADQNLSRYIDEPRENILDLFSRIVVDQTNINEIDLSKLKGIGFFEKDKIAYPSSDNNWRKDICEFIISPYIGEFISLRSLDDKIKSGAKTLFFTEYVSVEHQSMKYSKKIRAHWFGKVIDEKVIQKYDSLIIKSHNSPVLLTKTFDDSQSIVPLTVEQYELINELLKEKRLR